MKPSVEAVESAAASGLGQRCDRRRPLVLITGGAGFVGINLADRLLREGYDVRVLDNFSRAGVRSNLEWLLRKHRRGVEIATDDVRDADAVERAVKNCRGVFHFAAQVAVTSSLLEPRADFQINSAGTLNILEALRNLKDPPPLVFTSTNKVYGALDDLALVEHESRYRPADETIAALGISERQPLDFHSAYGCSKGAADQYVIDYARSFGLPTVVMRMSCIYGPHQCGTEDQGWVCHLLNRMVAGNPITIYGDGKQVRDLLFIDDLIDAFLLTLRRAGDLAGTAFNLGGGPANTLSLLELADLMTVLTGRRPRMQFGEPRMGDQKYYVSDTRKFNGATGWIPRVGVRAGIERLYTWLRERPLNHQAL